MSNLRERVANISETRKLASISNHSSMPQKYDFPPKITKMRKISILKDNLKLHH